MSMTFGGFQFGSWSRKRVLQSCKRREKMEKATVAFVLLIFLSVSNGFNAEDAFDVRKHLSTASRSLSQFPITNWNRSFFALLYQLPLLHNFFCDISNFRWHFCERIKFSRTTRHGKYRIVRVLCHILVWHVLKHTRIFILAYFVYVCVFFLFFIFTFWEQFV